VVPDADVGGELRKLLVVVHIDEQVDAVENPQGVQPSGVVLRGGCGVAADDEVGVKCLRCLAPDLAGSLLEWFTVVCVGVIAGGPCPASVKAA